MTHSDVAIIIPCYRVAGRVSAVIRSIPAHYRTIICVDDASPDDAAQEILALQDPRVQLIRHPRNRGVGGAMKSGFAAAMGAGAEVCVKMDGDGQMSGDDLDALVAPVLNGEADYAKGNRFVDLDALRSMPRMRLFGNAVLSFVSKLASGYWNMLDVNNGFIAVRADILREVDMRALDERYFFETSLLIELNIRRATVVDVEMPARYNGEPSSMRLGRILLTFPRLLVKGLLRRFYWRYLIEDFGVVALSVIFGVPLLLFGLIFGLYHWGDTQRTGQPATTGTVFLAALPIILGFQLLLAALLVDVLASPSGKRRALRDEPRVRH